MKTEWDYTKLADAYLERPDYAPDVLEKLVSIANLQAGDKVCDLGAGVAHLTLPLAKYGFYVDAVEPNDAMRQNGKKRTANLDNVFWFEGTGEQSGRKTGDYDFVTFGSSFNVCDRNLALKETWRLLKPGKYFTCLWNHRNLDDDIQKQIEKIIREYIPAYDYGSRREDQSEIISASGIFNKPEKIEGEIIWKQNVEDVIRAWKSHATLHRQAGEKFDEIIGKIADFLNSFGEKQINIPYTTRAWIAQRKN